MSKEQEFIKIRGAKTHNLKNIDLDIPINQISCVWGPSGSGKSTLAFHTLLAESKRRYLNSLPNDVKFFWNMPGAADVELIKPVLPAWGLAQNNPILGSRPNLSDMLSLSDHLQVIFHRWGERLCPEHLCSLKKPDPSIEVQKYFEKGTLKGEVLHVLLVKEDYSECYGPAVFPSRSFDEEGGIRSFEQEDPYWEIFRLKANKLSGFSKKLKESLKEKNFKVYLSDGKKIVLFQTKGRLTCPKCDYSVPSGDLQLDRFSPHSAAGACENCKGHGMLLEYDRAKLAEHRRLSIEEGAIKFIESSHFRYLKPALLKELKKRKFNIKKPFEEIESEELWDFLYAGGGDFPGMRACFSYLESKRYKRTVRIFIRRNQKEVLCEACDGSRIHKDVQNVFLSFSRFKLSFKDCFLKTPSELFESFQGIKAEAQKHPELLYKVNQLLNILKTSLSLGLKKEQLKIKAKKLTTSQYQRALLVKILSYQGSGGLFILDEPSLGLSLAEQKEMINALEKIKEQGNTIIMVEHSEFLKSSSDFLIEVGPEAGEKGGEILSLKKPRKKKFTFSKAPKLSSAKEKLSIPAQIYKEERVKSFFFPKKKTTICYGHSGALKKELLIHQLANSLHLEVAEKPLISSIPLELEYRANFPYRNVFFLDSSLGNSNSRSTVGTVLGLTPEVRKYYASLPVSKSLNLEKGHFSPNSELGRCLSCDGKGIKEIEMNFLEDMVLTCDDCQGMKIKPLYATISDGNQTAYEALSQPMGLIIPRLKLTAKFLRLWEYVKLLKLDYLSLNRTITSLSGGERMRIKLLSNLSSSIYESILFFENLSSGLSKRELEGVSSLFDELKRKDNTLVLLDENEVLFDMVEHSVNFQDITSL